MAVEGDEELSGELEHESASDELDDDEGLEDEDAAGELEHENDTEDEEPRTRAPWHFKILVVGTVGYLLYRLYQGIGWLVHHA